MNRVRRAAQWISGGLMLSLASCGSGLLGSPGDVSGTGGQAGMRGTGGVAGSRGEAGTTGPTGDGGTNVSTGVAGSDAGGTKGQAGTSGSACSGSVADPTDAMIVSGYLDTLPYGDPTGAERSQVIDAILRSCYEFGPQSTDAGWQPKYCWAHLVAAIEKESSYGAGENVLDSYGMRTVTVNGASETADDPTVGLLQIRFSSTVHDFAVQGPQDRLSCIGCTFPSTFAGHQNESGDSDFWTIFCDPFGRVGGTQVSSEKRRKGGWDMPLDVIWHRSTSFVAVVGLGLCLVGGLATGGCTFRAAERPSSGGGSGGDGTAGAAGSGASAGSGGIGGRGGAAGTAPMHCNPCGDLPAMPIIDMPPGGTAPPADVGGTFGPAGTGSATGGPCLSDPEPDSLFPRNWLRPRFVIQPGAGEDVFEIRLHADIESNDLVVYTTATTWTMPAAIWTALSTNVIGPPITVSVRGLVSSSGTVALGPTETITIAPTNANGTIVYWTTSGGSALKGFSVGQESVVTVLTPANTPGQCVGCHSSTPGGEYIGFSNSTSTTNGDPSHIEIRSGTAPATSPPFVTASAQALLQRVSQELPVFSPSHWSEGDYVTVFMHADGTSASGQNTHLLWIDLEAASQTQGVGWGEFMRNGDPNSAVAYPFFSHDGKRIVYVSAPSANPSGILQHGDLYSVDYGNRAGGTATPIDGAATTAYSEFYPALSSDDKLLAYTRLTDGANSYDNADSEVFIINSTGGTPLRHAANDPGMCLGKTSPGITNSWPKWSPQAATDSGKTYYWITFSSTRSGNPQLYVAGIVVDETGNVTTTPALYLWNQPPTENNHTPAWDTFIIPKPG